MILKLLLVIAVIGIVYFMFIKKTPIRDTKKRSPSKKSEQKSQEMVPCASCGTYCSVEDTILNAGKYYCSRECLEK
jgi:uncharacterized protein